MLPYNSLEIGLAVRVVVATVSDKGRCVFAAQHIPASATIEVAPVMHFPQAECDLIDKTTLENHYYQTRQVLEPGDASEYHGILPLGLATFCNHSDDPNAAFGYRRSSSGIVFVLSATRAILPDEEICVRYKDEVLWFENKPAARFQDTEECKQLAARRGHPISLGDLSDLTL
jgi:hypothetical protein